jgi:hypothetical protein
MANRLVPLYRYKLALAMPGTSLYLYIMANVSIRGAWDLQKTIETLALKNAASARRGKPCPVAARVVERLEALAAR